MNNEETILKLKDIADTIKMPLCYARFNNEKYKVGMYCNDSGCPFGSQKCTFNLVLDLIKNLENIEDKKAGEQ